jgi:hypothetical protein
VRDDGTEGLHLLLQLELVLGTFHTNFTNSSPKNSAPHNTQQRCAYSLAANSATVRKTIVKLIKNSF